MSFWRRAVAYAGTAFTGAMLLVAGLLKALDPGGFAEQIAADVPFLESLAHPLALGAVVVEVVLGTAYLLGFRRRLLLGAGMILVVIFLAVTVPKLGSDDPTGCGCFGNFVVRTPAEVVVEDLLMLGGLLLGLAGGPGSSLRAWRGAILALAAAVGAGLPLAAPSLPLDNFATRLKPGATAADLQLQEVIPELASGEHVVILAEASLDSCQDVPESLLGYADTRPEASFWILHPSDEMAREGATWLCLPGTEVLEVPRPVLRPLYRTLPRSFDARDGVVIRTWEGLPEG